MGLTDHETLTCDVLVVGGGGAGLRAAIAARQAGTDVLLVSKTQIANTTNTYFSKAVIAAPGLGDSADSGAVHITDTVEGGCHLNDRQMVARVAEGAGAEVAFLEKCGVRFGMDAGKIRVLGIPGHSFPRHVHGENWVGRDLVLPLKSKAQQVGVHMMAHLFVSRLLVDGGRIGGAAAIATDGRFMVLQAKTVILATGGYARIFLNTNNAPGITGDGQALAFNAGLPLMDMEFVQFYPTALGTRGNRLLLYERLLTQPRAALIDPDGEDILGRHGIADPSKVTRDQLARILMSEISNGGGQEQVIRMDLSQIPDDTARQLAQLLPPRWFRGEKVFAVAPTAHFCMGGIVTDPDGQTALPGLFAAGEAAAGVHGANRLGGNALAEIFTMGAAAGRKAAELAGTLASPAVAGEAVSEEKNRLIQLFQTDGERPRRLIQDLQALMWKRVGIIRRAEELAAALRQIEGTWPEMAVCSPGDLIRRLEFENMRLVARLVCRAALERTESRGSHFREDHPTENNSDWLQNIIQTKAAGEVASHLRKAVGDEAVTGERDAGSGR